MIDLYTWNTPNGRKIPIMLEEIKLPYTVHAVNIQQGEQLTPNYLKINPNNKIPAIIDHDAPGGKPLYLFESGAILIYLAEKTGKLLPSNPRERAITIQWLMFQMANLGPMLGQANHFLKFAKEKVPYAIERYSNEAKRLYGVLNKHLSDNEFLAGNYSIADIATFPWIDIHDFQQIDLDDYPHVKRWHTEIAKRPAVKKGMLIPAMP